MVRRSQNYSGIIRKLFCSFNFLFIFTRIKKEIFQFGNLPKFDKRTKAGKQEIYNRFCHYLNTVLRVLPNEIDRERVRHFAENNFDERQIINSYDMSSWMKGYRVAAHNDRYRFSLTVRNAWTNNQVNIHFAFQTADYKPLVEFDFEIINGIIKIKANDKSYEFNV